jgi:hypothetical protein
MKSKGLKKARSEAMKHFKGEVTLIIHFTRQKQVLLFTLCCSLFLFVYMGEEKREMREERLP